MTCRLLSDDSVLESGSPELLALRGPYSRWISYGDFNFRPGQYSVSAEKFCRHHAVDGRARSTSAISLRQASTGSSGSSTYRNQATRQLHLWTTSSARNRYLGRIDCVALAGYGPQGHHETLHGLISADLAVHGPQLLKHDLRRLVHLRCLLAQEGLMHPSKVSRRVACSYGSCQLVSRSHRHRVFWCSSSHAKILKSTLRQHRPPTIEKCLIVRRCSQVYLMLACFQQIVF